MIAATTTLYLYVETPLHAGVGSGLSSIDLPIQRERTTQYPMIQGSGIKGKLRAVAELTNLPDLDILFGSSKTEDKNENTASNSAAQDENKDHAGALIVGDARILLFPVRSLNGIFAYTTSRDVLNRFHRDISRHDANRGGADLPWEAPTEVEDNIALVTTKNSVTVDDMLVLEEFSFTAQKGDQIDKISQVDTIAQWIAENALPQADEYKYWRDKVQNSLVILPDNDFRDFVVNATEIITRIRIKRDTKTVDNGALWTEEYLPSDTLLYVPIYATNARKSKNGANGKSESAQSELSTALSILNKAKSLEESRGGYIQLGGDETVGRGMVRMYWEKKREN